MTLEEYKTFLADAREMGRDAVLPFMECVHLWALGRCVPEVRKVERWQAEYVYARERWGEDPRFVEARREAILEIEAAQRGDARWPEWAHVMGKLRFGVDVDPARVSAWEKVRRESAGTGFPSFPSFQGGAGESRVGCRPS